MQAWWEDLSALDQAAYFGAGLAFVYLLRFVPWSWLAKLPPGLGRSYESDAADDSNGDVGPSVDAGTDWPDFGGFPEAAGHGHGDAGHGSGGDGGNSQ